MTLGAAPSILDVAALFGRQFSGASWAVWRVVLAALFGLPMTEEQAAIFRRQTGRQTPPTRQAREGWLVVGRRGGKSRIAALVAVYLACFKRYRLAPGERGVVMLIAADRRQARVVFRYVLGLLNALPMLADLVQGKTKESISLANGIDIEIHVASFRSTRGYTIVGVVADEIAFWPTDDAAEPDTEILNAVRPAMATVPGALLLAISSPYARRGELWRAYREHFGHDVDPVLVWQAPTRVMNPDVPEDFVAAAYATDEASAAAEYGAEFRRDVESFVSVEAVDAVTVPGRRELPPLESLAYVGFVDPSGGSSDSMTMAVAHDEAGRAVLDCVREIRPPFSPEAAVAEFVGVLKSYRIATVIGDRYAGEWPREKFRQAGIEYQVSDLSRSDIYRELLAPLNSGRVELLDHARLRAQLVALERRTARGGRDSIDHAPGSHDDLINAAGGALVQVARPLAEPRMTLIDIDDDEWGGDFYGRLHNGGGF